MLAGLCSRRLLFVPPYGRIDIIDASDIRLLVLYPLITMVFITLVERLEASTVSRRAAGSRGALPAMKCCCAGR